MTPTNAEILAEAKRRWEIRERGFPAFTRMRWEDGTEVAQSIALEYAKAFLTAQNSDSPTARATSHAPQT